MHDLFDVPCGRADWEWNNPKDAAKEFLGTHPNFAMENPPWPFNESNLQNGVTHWPGAWLKRKA